MELKFLKKYLIVVVMCLILLISYIVSFFNDYQISIDDQKYKLLFELQIGLILYLPLYHLKKIYLEF